MAQARTGAANRSFTLKRNGLVVECFFNGRAKLERKIERYGLDFSEYEYTYDAKGHLTAVRRDGLLTEQYRYSPAGQRCEQKCEYRGWNNSSRCEFSYDSAGRLLRAGNATFYYDERGALSERYDCRGTTLYFYGRDTMLDKVILPNGLDLRYEYARSNPSCPIRRFRSGNLVTELAWTDPLRLSAYRNHDTLLEYRFTYDASGVLSKVRIDRFKPEEKKNQVTDWGRASADWLESRPGLSGKELEEFLERRSLPLELFCGCDQVGTPKIFTDRNGAIVKEVRRDSFGVHGGDSFIPLAMPIGFAGGLEDPDTGLVRFGWRDYDPGVGRFTAPDPANDRRGDGDVYDYCVDDPVGCVDPAGLNFMPTAAPRLRPEARQAVRQTQTQRQRSEPARNNTYYAAAPAPRTDATRQPRPTQTQPGAQPAHQRQAATGQAQADQDVHRMRVEQQWDRDRSLDYLRRNAQAESRGDCAGAVSRAIEAGGVRVNRELNPTRRNGRSGSAHAYGPVLEDAGFVRVPEGTPPQAGDVVIFPATTEHPHGHAAMYDGNAWRSDFNQIDIYGSRHRRNQRTPYILYRHP